VDGREAGKRSRKFFKTKAEAETFARTKEIELLNHGIAHAEFPVRLRTMAQDAVDKVRHLLPEPAPGDTADKHLAQASKIILRAVDEHVARLQACAKSCSAIELVRLLVNLKKQDGASQRHVSDLQSRLGIFADKFDGQPVATITSGEIDDWLRSLNVSPVTRNHYRRLIVLAFNFAVRRGYAAENPAKETAKAKERGGVIGILTVTQAARLLECATPDVLPYIAIGFFAGLRRAEIQRLDWSEIDFDSGLIEVKAEKSKTAQRRFVRIQPNLREWLLPLRKHKGNVTSEDFRKQFDVARLAAGIIEWPDNALRHSFASYHLAHFEDAASTALQLGHHDSRVTFAHYRELVRPKDAERYWNIKPETSTKVVPLVAG
jgi:integrase